MTNNDINQSELNDFLRKVVASPVYYLSIIFITILSFAFDVFNRTIGIDDLSRSHYMGEDAAMIKTTRWGMVVWTRLFTSIEFYPFIDKFLGVVFLVLGAIIFSYILYRYFENNRYAVLLCSVFSCLYISYPLINEIWNYNGANFMVAGNAVLAGLVVLLVQNNSVNKLAKLLAESLLLSIVVSSYESGMFLYITVVLSIVLMDYIELGNKNWIRNGFIYAIPLFMAIILRFGIGYTLIKINGLSYERTGDTRIVWLNSGASNIISLARNVIQGYIAKGLVYFPIGLYVVTILVGFVDWLIVGIKKQKIQVILIYVLLTGSTILLSVVQGVSMPYRTAQTLQYYIPFVLTAFLMHISLSSKKKMAYISFALLFYIAYRQGVYLNEIQSTNYQRSENERAIIQNIGVQLVSNYDKKPVVFVGSLDLGDEVDRVKKVGNSSIGEKIYWRLANRFGWKTEDVVTLDTNVNSVIDWNELAFFSQRYMGKYLSYYGFDVETLDYFGWWEYAEYCRLAVNNGFKPMSINDLGDVILVYFGRDKNVGM